MKGKYASKSGRS